MHLIHFSHFACPLQLVNRAVRYSFTFTENLTLSLGLLTAHPLRRDEWGEVSTGEVSGVLVSNTSTLDKQLTSPVDTSPHSSLRRGWAVSKPRGSVRFSEKVNEEEDIQCVQENSERQDLVDKVNKEIKVSHPICYDT